MGGLFEGCVHSEIVWDERYAEFEIRKQSKGIGVFSFGDILEKEIQKHGRFAFRGKHTSADCSERFVQDFIRARSEEGEWLWVPKGAALQTVERGLGFPARKSEIQRFGRKSRKIVRATSRRVDSRSFASVVNEQMDRKRINFEGRGDMRARLGNRDSLGRQAPPMGRREDDGRFNGYFRDRNFQIFVGGDSRGGFGGQYNSGPRRNGRGEARFGQNRGDGGQLQEIYRGD
ncbi:putative retroelement [Panicum miliaceum]|uniref:Retroelement n=1 Tax=Panicum miliaceum TaxID=4540 RepID=A0A3L6T3U8_PANMI|nr:putative retroelement [Panicum miliaceum]